ncbi:MAG: gliding motility protein GldN [Bacteroidales bacterium]|jgi:gliding motility associated protien GldN|nr:gliding motility protein GldN [Bacteroidales bacterium]
MKVVRFLLPIVIILITANFAKAQDKPVLDGAFIREHITERTATPLQNIREADAMWSKKILRVIQLDEKINHPLYFPITRITYPAGLQPQRNRVSLLYLIYNIGILGERYDEYTGALVVDNEMPDYSNRLNVYKLNGRDITNWYRDPVEKDADSVRHALLSYLQSVKRLSNLDDPDSDLIDAMDPTTLDDTKDMTQLWMWEEWVFDKQRSVMDVRIVAMAPDGYHGESRIWPFWIYYPEYRPIFAVNETFNSQNEAEHRSFDDIFLKRRFKSYIVAETNQYDNRLISDYMLGIDAMREGERIKENIFKIEHDMWEY